MVSRLTSSYILGRVLGELTPHDGILNRERNLQLDGGPAIFADFAFKGANSAPESTSAL